jgi:hypothetical protein
VSFAFAVRTVEFFPKCHSRLESLTIRRARYEHGTIWKVSPFARTPRRPDGAGSVSSSGTRSTSCILGAREGELGSR